MGKNLYLVLVCEHPSVSVGGSIASPVLPSGIKGYAPIYTSKKAAKKDWPKREIKELSEIKTKTQ